MKIQIKNKILFAILFIFIGILVPIIIQQIKYNDNLFALIFISIAIIFIIFNTFKISKK
jgi:hypothetical protein